MNPELLAALGIDPTNPLYAGLFAQQQQPQAQAPAPQAPGELPQAPAIQQQPDSINDGINSVGRPLDIAQGDAEAQSKMDSDHAKEYKKLLRQGKGEALLALGAGLLSGRTFGEGLSKGLLAYQQTLNAARDRLKPKHESIGNGQVERITDPVDDSVSYEETPLAKIERDKIDALTGRQLAVQDLRNQGSQNVAEINTGSREKIADLQWNTREKIAQLQSNTTKWAAQLRSDTAKDVAEINAKAGGKGNSRATASMLKLATEHQNSLNQTTMAAQNLAPVLQWLKSGQLTLSLPQNALRKAKIATGAQLTDEDKKFAVMQQVVEQNRNAILLAAKGVQTEGDAQRALNQILTSNANTQAVTANFEFLMNILKRQAENERNQLGMIRDNSGLTIPSANENKTSTGVSWKIVH